MDKTTDSLKISQENKVLYAPVKKLDLKKTIFKNLVMGGFAGIVGATICYPMDMIKTRLQNQKSVPGVERMYNNSLDCFKKILKAEGARGLYRGLPAQLVGITPEKALKLTANDFFRYQFTNKETGEIKKWQEMASGALAGFMQVAVTNPYEIVKVRLQTQSLTLEGHQRKSAFFIINELGLSGLYRGVGACLLRDVPFTAIYFTIYANLKKFTQENFVKSGEDLLLIHRFGCGIGAGMVSAFTVTPADVIKTRLQVKTAVGSVPYKGIVDAATRIAKEEGFKAFFKGSIPRMLIVSPLFGITLTVYEGLQGFFQ